MRAPSEKFCNKIPALAAYIGRIGAEENNFAYYAVTETIGTYKRELVTIKIARNTGEVKVYSPNFSLTKEQLEKYAPTKEEAIAIAIAWTAAIASKTIPRSIGARTIDELKKLTTGNLFPCIVNGEIVFVQERIETKDGGKAYLPWTFFSDGQWRNMEPDNGLPLYGQDKVTPGRLRFMVHEGPKAAARMIEWIHSDEWHPWKDFLKRCNHLGWLGGVGRPRATDWSYLKALPENAELYFPADNDADGKGVDAVVAISGILRRPMSMVHFDTRWPDKFDLADPWPEHPKWYTAKGKYIGPSIEDCLISCTWATEPVYTGEKGRPSFKVRRQFANEWVWVEDPDVFICKKYPNQILNEKTFNRCVRPFSDVEETGKLLIKVHSAKCHGVIYDPGKSAGVTSIDGRRLFNLYRPASIKPKEGSVWPFLRLCVHLIPNKKERLHLLRWITTLIVHPEIRVLYAVLLVSEVQGVGKGTLCEIVAKCLGHNNVSYPSENEIVESNFNSWIGEKLLAVVHEIYAGHSTKAYNRIKTLITDEKVRMNAKYKPQYDLDCWIRILACSNSTRAIQLSDSDRRFYVPKVTDQTRPKKQWIDLHRWLDDDDGYAKIINWAHKFIAKHKPILKGEHPPDTELKIEMMDEHQSDGKRIAKDLAERVMAHKETIIMAMDDVREFVAIQRGMFNGIGAPNLTNDRLEAQATLKTAMKRAGMFTSARKQISHTRKVYLVSNKPIPNAKWKGEGGLESFYRKPHDIKDLTENFG